MVKNGETSTTSSQTSNYNAYPPSYYRNLNSREIQGDKEICRQFVVAMATLRRRKEGYKCTKERTLECIFNNITEEYAVLINGYTYTHIPELIQQAEEYEAIMREKGNIRTTGNTNRSSTIKSKVTRSNERHQIHIFYHPIYFLS